MNCSFPQSRGQPVRQEGVCLAQQYAEGRASTRESLHEVMALGDTGVVSVPAFLDGEGREIWHRPHRRISVSMACLELILLFCSFPHQTDGLFLSCCEAEQRNSLI